MSLCIFFLPTFINAAEPRTDIDRDYHIEVDSLTFDNINNFTAQYVNENTEFFGLAAYYNGLEFYKVSKNELVSLVDGDFQLKPDEWLAIAGRFNVLVIKSEGLRAKITNEKIQFPLGPNSSITDAFLVDKPNLYLVGAELDQLRYVHLWYPLAVIARAVEWSLVKIQTNIVSNWGLAIIIFTMIVKILLIPIGIMTVNFQRQVSQHQTILAPQLAYITKHFDGEEAHHKIMAAHKAMGISPFYTIKPILGSFIQIPISIAVFNALGEMPQLIGATFLWIGDLAYPDSVFNIPTGISLFGDKVSLMPFLMTLITVYSTLIFKDRHAPADELKKQKRNLYLMALSFFVLFYPFPAAMVLYWALTNVLQTIQQQIIQNQTKL